MVVVECKVVNVRLLKSPITELKFLVKDENKNYLFEELF